jgi:hypothetical protein
MIEDVGGSLGKVASVSSFLERREDNRAVIQRLS